MQIKSKNFNIKQIAESGQCFRMNKIEDNRYSLIAFGRYIELYQKEKDVIELSCSEEEYQLLWEEYFDLGYDYNHIIEKLINGKDQFLKEAAEFGIGIRILKQDFFEMMISYIISQNKNIPAIKNCIEALSERYGSMRTSDECGGIKYFTFPTPEALTTATKEELRQLKVGYRDEYIIRASQAITGGDIDLAHIKNCSYEEAWKALMGIHGIGGKVANCICLYGLHHIEVFPVDVWIKRILNEIYQDQFNLKLYEGHAGIVQQYMFYYMRNRKLQDGKKDK